MYSASMAACPVPARLESDACRPVAHALLNCRESCG